ncbi:hypothetical protein KZX37_02575 [Microbacterium sp. EYE_5]|uniref:hypothetical protein n=1 Tax=unclassified Microbacterium TaxID=2609290 RepID=UPI00200650F0|nr:MULTISPECIES: hypothetical protein [unclassified Microbacterium]MCK6079504.1 hypothetical protein [Microbacterium sp. EYE_382]MCK6084774.1 hypothetical protein [Microbacterium sp. EYE_384]MCK6122999.1 hypothetical protein [Microbacterium sp. EYE_80]MCK6125538.1 hypothetical protein [Microbacterium sp. EYE_79]MCK6140458.1 hypothetical protein [Microbacterium sp. EYE_39]
MSEDPTRVPVRSKDLLEQWVAEFMATWHSNATTIKVAVQDGSDGRDTGLVVVHLVNANADIYMEPVGIDRAEWATTLTARPSDATLSPYSLVALGAEVTMAGNLCMFLQFKSLEWDRMTGMH